MAKDSEEKEESVELHQVDGKVKYKNLPNSDGKNDVIASKVY